MHGAWGSSSSLPYEQSGPEILGTRLGSKEDREPAAQILPSALGGVWAGTGLGGRRPRPPASDLLSQAQGSLTQTTPEGGTQGWSAAGGPEVGV